METNENKGGEDNKETKKEEDEEEVVVIGKPTTSYAFSQARLRKLIIDFFQEEEKAKRLKTLLELHLDIGHRLMFFVSKYAKNKLYNLHGIPRCPAEMYKNELRSTRKRFFDFESLEGTGNLIYESERNPTFLIVKDIRLVLPFAQALRWFIANGLDLVYISDLKELDEAYDKYNIERRTRYSQKHKSKRKQIRAEIELLVREEAKKRQKEEQENENEEMSEGESSSTAKRKCWLSQPERREVNRRMNEYLQKNKKMKRRQRNKDNSSIGSSSMSRGEMTPQPTLLEVGKLFESILPIL